MADDKNKNLVPSGSQPPQNPDDGKGKQALAKIETAKVPASQTKSTVSTSARSGRTRRANRNAFEEVLIRG